MNPGAGIDAEAAGIARPGGTPASLYATATTARSSVSTASAAARTLGIALTTRLTGSPSMTTAANGGGGPDSG